MSIKYIVQFSTKFLNYYLVDTMCLFDIMVRKGDLWREDVKYAEEVLRAVAISVTHTMSPKENSR